MYLSASGQYTQVICNVVQEDSKQTHFDKFDNIKVISITTGNTLNYLVVWLHQNKGMLYLRADKVCHATRRPHEISNLTTAGLHGEFSDTLLSCKIFSF